jgi:hypothetical protein
LGGRDTPHRLWVEQSSQPSLAVSFGRRGVHRLEALRTAPPSRLFAPPPKPHKVEPLPVAIEQVAGEPAGSEIHRIWLHHFKRFQQAIPPSRWRSQRHFRESRVDRARKHRPHDHETSHPYANPNGVAAALDDPRIPRPHNFRAGSLHGRPPGIRQPPSPLQFATSEH